MSQRVGLRRTSSAATLQHSAFLPDDDGQDRYPSERSFACRRRPSLPDLSSLLNDAASNDDDCPVPNSRNACPETSDDGRSLDGADTERSQFTCTPPSSVCESEESSRLSACSKRKGRASRKLTAPADGRQLVSEILSILNPYCHRDSQLWPHDLFHSSSTRAKDDFKRLSELTSDCVKIIGRNPNIDLNAENYQQGNSCVCSVAANSYLTLRQDAGISETDDPSAGNQAGYWRAIRRSKRGLGPFRDQRSIVWLNDAIEKHMQSKQGRSESAMDYQ